MKCKSNHLNDLRDALFSYKAFIFIKCVYIMKGNEADLIKKLYFFWMKIKT